MLWWSTRQVHEASVAPGLLQFRASDFRPHGFDVCMVDFIHQAVRGWAAWQGTCCARSLHREAPEFSFLLSQCAQTCWQDLFPALESRGLMEAHTLSLCLPHFPQRPGTGYWWHLPVALPSPLSLAGGCGWHLYFFLLQLNSLNQSQELKPLKEPDAIWRAGLRARVSPPRQHWFKEAKGVLAFLHNTKPCTGKGSDHLKKHQSPPRSALGKAMWGVTGDFP